MDAIQHRYGWTDETVHNLDWQRFRDLVKLIGRVIQREAEVGAKNRLYDSAFLAFQLGAAGEGKTFGDYLQGLGLSDPPAEEEAPAARVKVPDNTATLARMGIVRGH